MKQETKELLHYLSVAVFSNKPNRYNYFASYKNKNRRSRT